ncbi:MAG: flavodoxin family protein [Nitrospirota bacterium]|nr:MAG: flavodoxin family protein [Nitrospirota bacterium]
MKVVAFNGSARKGGNTYELLNLVCEEIKNEGIDTEIIQFGGKHIQGCIACYKCFENKNMRCNVDKDDLNFFLEKMLEADGILLGSPTYVADMSTNMKALIERAGLVSRANGDMFKRKVGAGVVAARRGGATNVFSTMNYFFFIAQMIVPGSSYWNFAIGKDPGEVMSDEEGIQTMRTLGENMAWLIKKVNS